MTCVINKSPNGKTDSESVKKYYENLSKSSVVNKALKEFGIKDTLSGNITDKSIFVDNAYAAIINNNIEDTDKNQVKFFMDILQKNSPLYKQFSRYSNDNSILADKILNGEIDKELLGYSTKAIRKLFADNKELEPPILGAIKFKTAPKSGDLGIDKFTKKVVNLIRLLDSKQFGTVGEKNAIKREIDDLENVVSDLISEQDIKSLIPLSKKQFTKIYAILKNNPTDADFAKMGVYLSVWENLDTIFTYDINSPEFTIISDIVRNANYVRSEFNSVAKRHLLNSIQAKWDGISYESLFSAKKNENVMRTYFLGSTMGTLDLEQYLSKLIHDAALNTNIESGKKGEKIKELGDNLRRKHGVRGFNKLFQKNKNKETGNLVGRTKHEFYVEAGKLSGEVKAGTKTWAEYWAWMDNNAHRISGEEATSGVSSIFTKDELEKQRELLVQFDNDRDVAFAEIELLARNTNTDSEGNFDQAGYENEVSGEKEFWSNKWSPYIRWEAEKQAKNNPQLAKKLNDMQGYTYAISPKPKSIWDDPDYDVIMRDGALKEFYEHFRNTMAHYLPDNTGQYKIPQIAKNLVQDIADGGLTEGFKHIGKGVVDSFTVDYINESDYGVLDEQGKPVRNLKVNMFNIIETAKMSHSLDHVLMRFVEQAAAVKHKSFVEQKVLLLESIIQDMKEVKQSPGGSNMKDYNSDDITFNGLSNIKERVRYTVDVFYGQYKTLEGVSDFKIKGKHIVASKAIDQLIKYTQLKGIGLNPFSAITNVAVGLIQNFSHSARNQEFSDKDMVKATGVMMKSIFTRSNKQNMTLANKVASLMANLRVLGELTYSADYGKSSAMDKAFIMQKLGEHFLQGQVMVATLTHMKVKDNDGNESSLWDAYGNDGELLDRFSNLGYNISEVNGTFKASENTQKLSAAIRGTIDTLHGNYDLSSPMLAKKYIIGRLLTTFRTWIPATVENRFGGLRPDRRLGRETKGRYISAKDMFKELKFWGGLGVILKLSFIGKLAGAKVEDLSELDLANMKANMRELSILTMLYGAALLLKAAASGDDDHDKKTNLLYLLNVTTRLRQDITFYVNYNSAKQIIRDPIPAMKTISDIYNVMPAIYDALFGDDDKRARGKLGRKVRKAFPIINQTDNTINLMDMDYSTYNSSR